MKTILIRIYTSLVLFLIVISAQAQMPGAIKISPEGANGFDEITLTFYPDSACFPLWAEGLGGLDSIAMHSSAVSVNEEILSWNHTIWFNQPGFNGKMPILYADSDTSYSITFVPAEFYGTGTDPIVGISAVFNDGINWERVGKEHGAEGCMDFFIPLDIETASVTFNVKMGHQIFLGRFDPIFDFIDVAGNFNNWGNPGTTMTDSALEVIDSVYSVTIDDLYVGQQIEYKFRKNKDWAFTELDGYDLNRKYIVQEGENEVTHWFDDAEPIIKTLTLNVNMNYLLETGGFDPVEDSVDVAGTFNGWGFGDTIYWLNDLDADGIYTVVIDSIYVGEPVLYKFRLDATWGRNELPGGTPNRYYVIVNDTNLLTHWWNNDDPARLNDLFIAEYIDGPGDNNALVIVNKKNETIGLADYGLMYATDGSDWSAPLPLDGTLSGNDFYLIVNEGFDFTKIDSARVVDSVWTEVTSFDGNDAIALVKIFAGGTKYRVLDLIGVPLVDPVTGWEVAGMPDATKGKRLKRKSSILRGQHEWMRSAGTNQYNSEWMVLDPGIPDQLGKYRRAYTLANQWHAQSSGVDKTLQDITFNNEGEGIAVGLDGTLLYSGDNGNTWETINQGTLNHLMSVHFPDKDHGWIVGQGGTILHTTNGTDWSGQDFGAGNYLESVFFIDSLTGFITGEYVLLKTTDGGQSWNWLHSENLDWFNEIYFINDQVGFAVGYNLVIMTRDGGQSWNRVPFSADKHFHSVFFFNQKIGWMLGWNGLLMHTVNGGLTWSEQIIHLEGSIRDLHFVTPDIGWAVGMAGEIFKTIDGGVNWVGQSSGTDDMLINVHFVSLNKGWAVGDSGTILSTRMGNATFNITGKP